VIVCPLKEANIVSGGKIISTFSGFVLVVDVPSSAKIEEGLKIKKTKRHKVKIDAVLKIFIDLFMKKLLPKYIYYSLIYS
jgi:hypothetical protein